jgi:hypothetical protein
MPRWEYMTVIAIRQAAEFDVWRAAYIDGKEQPDWHKGPPIYEVMNEWGAAGWELVSVVPSGTRISVSNPTVTVPISYRLIFKRPI